MRERRLLPRLWLVPAIAAAVACAAAPPGFAAGPAADTATPPPSPAASPSPGAVPQAPGEPRELKLRARDGHAFSVDEYLPAHGTAGTPILLIPDLGQTRRTLGTISARLREAGYHVFAMDNTGQTRSVQATRGRAPTFARIDSRILELLRLDMDAAGEALRSGSGAGSKYAVVGYGIGANVAIMYAGDNPEVGALALILPGHDCEQYEASDLIATYGPRPLLLIESKSRTPSDLSQTIRLYIASGKDSSKERFALQREPVPSGEEQGYGSDELCDWLQRRLPAAKP